MHQVGGVLRQQCTPPTHPPLSCSCSSGPMSAILDVLTMCLCSVKMTICSVNIQYCRD